MRRFFTARRITTAFLVAALVACADTAAPRGTPADSRGERATPVYGDWTAPVNLGPVVNSGSSDQHPAISRDGLSLYFASDRPGGFGGLDIYVSHRASLDAPWGTPVNLGPLINSDSADLAPAFTPDGHRLFFHSGRAGGCGDFDLYESHRRDPHDDFGWTAPKNLGCVINGPYKDAGPTYTEEGGTPTLYFTSTRPGGFGDFDIYKSAWNSSHHGHGHGNGDVDDDDGSWGPAVHVDELSGCCRDTRTAISRDGLELFVSSDVNGRVGGIGGQDIWRSTRAATTDPWSTPANLGAVVNTTAFDGAPALSRDGTTMYFFSNRPGGSGGNDLYVTTRPRLN